MKRAVIFSYRTAGFGARKASIVFLAAALAVLGWQTDFVTAQLSPLSALAAVPRLRDVPESRRNVSISWSERLSAYVRVPLFQPATATLGWYSHTGTYAIALTIPRDRPRRLNNNESESGGTPIEPGHGLAK